MFAMQIPDPETEEWLIEATAENYMAVYKGKRYERDNQI